MANNNYYVGLVHHPVLNKYRETITTSVTNMDIHDIARTCCTYGIRNYFIINPLQSQKELYQKIIEFWQSNIGQNYQPDRAQALQVIVFQDTLQNVVEYIKNQEQVYPIILTTTALKQENQLDYESYFSVINDKRPVLILFGTGYGLTEEVHKQADYILEPIDTYSGYNHLSVRSAIAIVLDRLVPKNKGGINGHTTSSQQRTDKN